MQRLVQKEKDVSQLQSEIDHLKSLNPAEIYESVRCYQIQMPVCVDFVLFLEINLIGGTN